MSDADLTKDEPPIAATTGAQGTQQNEQADCDDDGAHVKHRATLTARLALLGYTLHELSSGAFIVSRWDRTRHLIDLHAVRGFLHQIGGPQ